jgi:hypothetical protein
VPLRVYGATTAKSWSKLRPSTFCRRSRALSRETRASSRPSKFCRCSRALSREIQASSPARLRLSSARRSSVYAPLTEGEHTDAVASCWRRDDRDLDLVEPECAMPSSRSMSSHHCFMALGEAVELGGWRSNSLAADNAPGAALVGVWDACAGVCCRVACTAAALDAGRLDTRGVEDVASSSTRKSSEVSARCSMICTIMLSQKTSKKPNAKSPYLACQMLERKSPAGWWNAPALNPKMRRGPKRFACWMDSR